MTIHWLLGEELDRAHALMEQWHDEGNPDWEILHRLIASEGYAETAIEELGKVPAMLTQARTEMREEIERAMENPKLRSMGEMREAVRAVLRSPPT